MDLVDEQDRFGHAFKLVDHLLEAFLEIAAITRAGEQRAHIERIDHRFLQDLGDLALDDLAREPFGNSGFAYPGVADIERVILAAPAQDLDRAIDFGSTADQRIDAAVLGLAVQVDGELVEGGFLLALVARLVLVRRLRAVGAFGRAVLDLLAALADAVADEADGIEAAHVLLLQEIDRVAVALGE